jgi:hypothetical protein
MAETHKIREEKTDTEEPKKSIIPRKKDGRRNNIQKGLDNLKLLHLNIRSLANKLDALEIELARSIDVIDILCITEHWLPKELQDVVMVQNYVPAAMFCRQATKGGGSAIYVKTDSNIQYFNRNDINQRAVEGELEICSIEITAPAKIVLIVCYRPPKSNVNVFLCKLWLKFYYCVPFRLHYKLVCICFLSFGID